MRKTIHDSELVADQSRTFIKNNIKRGIYHIGKSPVYQKLAIIYLIVATVLLMFHKSTYFPTLSISANYFINVSHFLGMLLFAYIIAPVIVCYIAGQPWKYSKIEKAFMQSNIVNAVGEPPAVLVEKKAADISTGKVSVIEVAAKGIAPSIWSDNLPALETALNRCVAKITRSKDRHTYLVWTAPPDMLLKATPWDSSFVDDNDAIIYIGTGYLGNVSFDCDNTPHACIVASSGGGKTRLLMSIVHQFILHKAVVYVVDFKGGVDFKKFGNSIVLIQTYEAALESLEAVINEINRRKILFFEHNVVNITEYRQSTGEFMPRILFCVDETVQLLEKKGSKKGRKEMIEAIEEHISTISQIGRSYGVSLILSGQRLDRTTISPQIFNNFDVKIAGRCDSVLSQIMFNDNRADELIPKEERGLFINHNNELFRSYFIK